VKYIGHKRKNRGHKDPGEKGGELQKTWGGFPVRAFRTAQPEGRRTSENAKGGSKRSKNRNKADKLTTPKQERQNKRLKGCTHLKQGPDWQEKKINPTDQEQRKGYKKNRAMPKNDRSIRGGGTAVFRSSNQGQRARIM